MGRAVLLALSALAAFLGLEAVAPPAAPKRPVTDTYHGFGTALDEALDQRTDVWAFLFRELGLEYLPLSR